MDNREFARVLLSEATELLESYGANGAGRKFYEERIKRDEKFIKDNKKKAEMYKRAGYEDKGPGKLTAKAKQRIEENKEEALKYETRQTKKEFESSPYGEDAAQKSRWYIYADADNDYAYADDDYSNATYSAGLRGVKSHKYINRKLHNRINKRVQNESIAILLTEAALLLND